MIRKTIIVLLTSAAVMTCILGVVSLRIALRFEAFGVSAASPDRRRSHNPPDDHVVLWFDSARVGATVTYFDRSQTPARQTFWNFAGLSFESFHTYLGEHSTLISAPFWIPLIVFAAYPIIAFIRGPVRRVHRIRKGLCLHCGNNLTANVSGVCPECGTEINKP